MKIIILGAGQVGATVANNLSRENNDVTVVDTAAKVLDELKERLDLRTIHGFGCHPDVLRRAGGEDADMIIAATNSDEVNMVACQIAYTLFHTPTKIARIRAQEYLGETTLFSRDHTPIDVLISPERLVTDHVRNIIEHPGALQVKEFANGLVRLVGIKVHEGGPMVGHELSTLREHIPGIDTRVVAIYREERAIRPEGHTIIQADDEVFFLVARDDTRAVMREMRQEERLVRRVMIAGGGNIGKSLALSLEKHCHVKVIEANPARAEHLAENLDRALVLQGDAADQELLVEENIDDMDVFCALTNDDEANILSAMLAKRMGASKVMSLINRPAYVDLVESGIVDIAISPQQVTIGALLTHIRRGDVVAVHSLQQGAAEAIEAIAHGDKKTSKVVGRRLGDIVLPSTAVIGALVRGEEVIIAHDHIMVESGDHVIVFVTDKRQIPEVERLFSVDVFFV